MKVAAVHNREEAKITLNQVLPQIEPNTNRTIKVAGNAAINESAA